MGRLIRWAAVVLVGAGIAALIWLKSGEAPVEVSVKPVIRGSVEKSVANTRAGTVNACRRARLSPSIGGQIARLPIREGDQVAAGDLLLEIWNEDLAAQVAVTRQEAEVARARAEATCTKAEEAKRLARRAEQLFERQVWSEEQTDQAVTAAGSLEAQCLADRAAVQMSQAQIVLSEANLSRSRLLAPFDGIIAKIEGELNEFVTPSPVGVQTPPAVDLIENSCFYVTAPIDEVDAAAVRVGMPARITLDAFRELQFTGTVRRIAPYVLDLEKQARTVDIEVAFDKPEDYANLLAGYSADVEIILDVQHDTLKIPTEAVLDGTSVFTYLPDEQLVKKTTFTPGLSNWVETEVSAGLQEGQSVVITIDKPGLADGVSATAAHEAP